MHNSISVIQLLHKIRFICTLMNVHANEYVLNMEELLKDNIGKQPFMQF